MNAYEVIREYLSQEELLAQLAEEEIDEAYQHLKEEIADVMLVIDVLGVGRDHMERCMRQANKLSRWVHRLEEKITMAQNKPCPCRDCKVHTSICLFICKAYKEWKAENAAWHKEVSKAKYEYDDLTNYVVAGKDKMNRKRKYKW